MPLPPLLPSRATHMAARTGRPPRRAPNAHTRTHTHTHTPAERFLSGPQLFRPAAFFPPTAFSLRTPFPFFNHPSSPFRWGRPPALRHRSPPPPQPASSHPCRVFSFMPPPLAGAGRPTPPGLLCTQPQAGQACRNRLCILTKAWQTATQAKWRDWPAQEGPIDAWIGGSAEAATNPAFHHCRCCPLRRRCSLRLLPPP